MDALRLPEPICAVLAARGRSEPDDAKQFLRPRLDQLSDPALLADGPTAAERIVRAIRDGERIFIHGDYDVDGVTGTSLLMRLFAHLGARATWHIPNRLVDGYSFGEHSIQKAEATGAEVVVSVDNGTSAHDVIGALKERGIDTVVTDHHEAPPGALPDAVAIVNPKLPDSTYPWRELCGGAVAFKLAWGLCQRLAGKKKVDDNLKRFRSTTT